MKADSYIAASSQTRAKAIHRRTGRTFYYATRLLPERVREPTYVLYGFFRIADEVVDGAAPAGPAAQRRELETLRDAALGEVPADDPVVAAFSEVRDRHDIPAPEVEAFIDAMIRDVDTDRYETAADLAEYTRGSAAAVGHMMTAVMDADDPAAAGPHAAALGDGFQLTNFLRDVREDWEDLGRIYLPQETLRRYGVTEADFDRSSASDGLRAAVRHELGRTERKYREGVAGIEHLPRDCQFPVLLASVLYAEHHRLIRKQNYDVLRSRPSLSTPRKLWLVAKTGVAWRRLGDPVAVFRRVSAVPEAESDPAATVERPSPQPTPN